MPKCALCGEESPSLAHLDVERINLELITRDHPEWLSADGSCAACLFYYEDLGPDVGVEEEVTS